MAKFNNNRKNNSKPSYFKENINRFGEDFISKKTTLDFDKDSMRIIRDLAFGNVVFETEGQYLFNMNLLAACIKRAYSNYYESYYNYLGNQYLVSQGYNDQMLEYTMNYNMRRRDAYAIIWNALENFKNCGDINWLIGLRAQLTKYRSNI